MTNQPLSWDIYCRVVDNFGDIGVCWRLARQLAAEHGGRVRLWVDDLSRWHALHPAGDAMRDIQSADGVEVRRWTRDTTGVPPADVAIDAFGCGLPDDYAAALAARRPRSIWITLEYLSAEPWVRGHHGLPSPHPRLDVRRYFYFPGFGPGTGGLLREYGLLERRDAFDAAARAAFWTRIGFDPPAAGTATASLFAYGHAPVASLLDCWADDDVPRMAAVPWPSALSQPVAAWLGADAAAGSEVRRGSLALRLLPFLPQRQYDQLLWSCDVNFVRGEDSFVRAQWAGRPFVWHIYPQQDEAHCRKLEAFLDRYCAGCSGAAAGALRRLWRIWNGMEGDGREVAGAWRDFSACAAELAGRSGNWARSASVEPDLARQLAQFCMDRLK